MDLKVSGLGEKIAEVLNKYDYQTHVVASCRSNDDITNMQTNIPYTPRQMLQSQPVLYHDVYWREQLALGFTRQLLLVNYF